MSDEAKTQSTAPDANDAADTDSKPAAASTAGSKRRRSSSSKKQQQQHVDDDGKDENHEDPNDDNDDNESPEAAEAAGRSATKRNRLGTVADIDMQDVEAMNLPSFVRRTANGGYSHTNASRFKIGMANKGNTPWNKGKNRTASTKSNISAGVRARNREKLLKKLAILNMTEQEYLDLRKEIKYVRERVRQTKVHNEARVIRYHKENEEMQAKIAAWEAQKKLAEEEEEEGEPEVEIVEKIVRVEKIVYASSEEEEEACEGDNDKDASQKKSSDPPKQPGDGGAAADGAADGAAGGADDGAAGGADGAAADGAAADGNGSDGGVSNSDDDDADEREDHMPSVFRRDIQWIPHEYDSRKATSPYTQKCPTGGPGGLICCQPCATRYAAFALDTYTNMEREKIRKIAAETETLRDFLQATNARLKNSIRVARRVPPILRSTLLGSHATEESRRAAENDATDKEESEEELDGKQAAV